MTRVNMNRYSLVFLRSMHTFNGNKGLIALGMERVMTFLRKGRHSKYSFT